MGAPTGSKLTINSVKVKNQELIDSNIEVLNHDDDDTITLSISNILGALDQGGDGVSLGNLKKYLNGDIIITGKVTKDNFADYPVKVTLQLGSHAIAPEDNEYFKIEKLGLQDDAGKQKRLVRVTFNTKEDVTFGTLSNEAINFPDVLASVLNASLSEGDVEGGNAVTAAAIKIQLQSVITGNTLELTKLSNMDNKSINVGNDYKVEFVAGNW